jgi:hypothetical protein
MSRPILHLSSYRKHVDNVRCVVWLSSINYKEYSLMVFMELDIFRNILRFPGKLVPCFVHVHEKRRVISVGSLRILSIRCNETEHGEWVASVLAYKKEVPRSNLGLKIAILIHVFCGSPQPLQTSAVILSKSNPQSLPSTSCPIHDSLINILFDAIQPEMFQWR